MVETLGMSTKPKREDRGGMPGAKGPVQGVQRGTQDELEILGLIVATSPNIRLAVLEAIRKAKKRMQDREKRSGPVAE